MAHRFFAHAGFLIDGEPGSARAPYREEFMLLDAAAHECSLEVLSTSSADGVTAMSLHTGSGMWRSF